MLYEIFSLACICKENSRQVKAFSEKCHDWNYFKGNNGIRECPCMTTGAYYRSLFLDGVLGGLNSALYLPLGIARHIRHQRL